MDVDAIGADQGEQIPCVNPGGLEKLLPQRPAKLFHLPVKRPPDRGKNLAYQGVTVGVKT